MLIPIQVTNKLGLHARASAKLAQLAARFESNIHIGKDEQNLVDCKSIMELMLLAAGIGSELVLMTRGNDEEEAATQIKALFDNKFDEGE